MKVFGIQKQETLNGLTAGPLTLTPLQSTLLFAHLKREVMETWLAEHKTWTVEQAKAVLLEAARYGEGLSHRPSCADKARKSGGLSLLLSATGYEGPVYPRG